MKLKKRNCKDSKTQDRDYLRVEPTKNILTCDGGNEVLCKLAEFCISLIDNGELIVNIWRLDGTLIKFNNYAQKKTGYAEEEVLGVRWINKIIPESHIVGLNEMFNLMADGKVPPVTECKFYCKDGRDLDIMWSNYLMRDAEGNPYLAISVGMDITELKNTSKRLFESYEELQWIYNKLESAKQQLQEQLEEQNKIKEALIRSKERYKLVVDGSNHGLWDMDLKSGEHFYSDRCIEMLGYTRDEVTVLFKSWKELVHPEDKNRIFKTVKDYLNKKIPEYNVEYRLRNKQDEYIWVSSTGAAIWDENNKPIRIAGSQTNIQEKKRAEEEIYKTAYYDELTGLPNRTMLLQQLSSEITSAKLTDLKIALLFMDLDNFKDINDTLGHNNGDELLKVIGGLFYKFTNKNITAARFGGDEFVLLIRNIEGKNAIVGLCNEVVEEFKKPISINNREFHISISIGAAIYPEDGQDEYTLLKNADIAMYNAKEQTGNKFILFDDKMNLRMLEKLDLENGLRNALKNNEFIIYYQPQVNISSNKIVGLEALIRWNHPTQGLIPPFRFIPIAEETGLIIEIGEWVLRKACEQFVIWENNKLAPQRMAVNISAKQFEQSDFIDIVEKIMVETKMDPKFLELEITESIAMKNLDYTIKVINELKKHNIKTSLDDFGTGFSSLNYLMRLPINTLKIDKSFLDNIKLNSNEELIAKTIIKLAKKMKLDVVAEGVETTEQLNFLKKQKCNTVQGYLFSKPIPENEVESMLIGKKILR